MDWNLADYGKLWTYNLNYFEFLHIPELSQQVKIELLDDFVLQRSGLRDGLEPYPISLRAINWIRFFSRNPDVVKEGYNETLYAHLDKLCNNPEYHILGNHLLENALALLMGSYYFKEEKWYTKAKKLLFRELTEQLQDDGGHFEQSPMYHNIIFYRVLEAIDLVSNNDWQSDDLLPFLKQKASFMLSWMENVSFNNRDTPMVNDAAPGIACPPEVLKKYASIMGVISARVKLADSGYRLWRTRELEMFIDAGPIAVDYQPGHAHADTFSFVLNYKDKPIIVDTGTSTYEKNERRQLERSTESHNTVAYANENSSEVWGGFRVGRRAKVRMLEESSDYLRAEHTGYKHLGAIHRREFETKSNELRITDTIDQKKNRVSKSYLHFHPMCRLNLTGNELIVNEELIIRFTGFEEIELQDYLFAMQFNELLSARRFCGRFTNRSKITITVYEN